MIPYVELERQRTALMRYAAPMSDMKGQVLHDRFFRRDREEGQQRLSDRPPPSSVAVRWARFQAETLWRRAGVGRSFSSIAICVRVEPSAPDHPLKKQMRGTSAKSSVAAARLLSRVNSAIQVEPIVADGQFRKHREIIDGANVVMDGTDNFETRFLINDACVKAGIPWVYGAAVGSYGLTMTIVPDDSPCLRCVLEAVPEPGSGPTCDTAGVIMPIISIIASIQSAEALKLLAGRAEKLHRSLLRIDVWKSDMKRLDLSGFERRDCPTCVRREFEFLRGARRQVTTTLCGRNAVQIAGRGTRK